MEENQITMNMDNQEELQNLNLNSNENLNYRDSLKNEDEDKLNDNDNYNDNQNNISAVMGDNIKKGNLDSILKDFNSMNTENKNIIKIKENEQFSQDNKIFHPNLLKESAYEKENNNIEIDLQNINENDQNNQNEDK